MLVVALYNVLGTQIPLDDAPVVAASDEDVVVLRVVLYAVRQGAVADTGDALARFGVPLSDEAVVTAAQKGLPLIGLKESTEERNQRDGGEGRASKA